MQKLTIIHSSLISDWLLTNVIRKPGNGSWAFGDAELFQADGEPAPHHIHFYTDIETARTWWPQMKRFVPPTVKTVSFEAATCIYCGLDAPLEEPGEKHPTCDTCDKLFELMRENNVKISAPRLY